MLLSAYTFNESGFADYSGNKRPCDTSAGVSFATDTGINGKACVFGGVANSYASSSAWGTGLPSVSGFTVAAYLKFNVLSTSHSNYIARQISCFDFFVDMFGTLTFTVWAGGSPYTVTFASPTADGNYHSIAGVWDGATVTLWIDGLNVASTAAVFASLLFGMSNPLILGNDTASGTNYLNAKMDAILLYGNALTADNILALNAEPEGTLMSVDNHPFELGDLLGDQIRAFTGCVTFVPNDTSFYILPFGPFTTSPLLRYGNVFDTNRQSILEVDNDFDGNGNAQVRILSQIASFPDYDTPVNEQMFDYRGLTNVRGSGLIWMAEYTHVPNTAGVATNAYTDKISANMLGTEGDSALFRFNFKVNVSGGSIAVIMGTTSLWSISPGTGNYWVKGEIVATDIVHGTADVFIEDSTGAFFIQTITTNFHFDQNVILQLNSAGAADIVAYRGSGILRQQNVGN